MGQASVLSDSEIVRTLKIISIGRHPQRNRMAFLLTVWGGMRVGEIAALTVDDVMTNTGEIVKEIRLRADQTKGRSYARKLVTGLSGGVFGLFDSVLERHSFDEFGEVV